MTRRTLTTNDNLPDITTNPADPLDPVTVELTAALANALTATATTSPGAAWTPADRAAFLAWGRQGYGGRGARLVIEVDHEGYPELGAAYLPIPSRVFGPDWRLVRHVHREASTGDVVVNDGVNRPEIARGGTMAATLRMPGVAITKEDRR